jgi:hypothetical protein
VRASTSLGYSKLVRCVEDSLGKLGYAHLKNGTDRVTEFEVERPCHFRVLVEDQTVERFGMAILRSEKGESTVEILRSLEASESDDELAPHVSAFVEQLRRTLPPEPWKGLGLLRSRAEKLRWSELSRLSEGWQR